MILGGSGKLNVASGVQRRLDRILDDTNDKADTNDLHRNVIGDAAAGGYGIRPYGAGVMLVIPNKSLKQKIPEQTFEDFGADEGI